MPKKPRKPILRPLPLPKPPDSYFFSKPCRPFAQGFLLSKHNKGTIPKNRPFVITPYLALSDERSENNDTYACKAHRGKAYKSTSTEEQRHRHSVIT